MISFLCSAAIQLTAAVLILKPQPPGISYKSLPFTPTQFTATFNHWQTSTSTYWAGWCGEHRREERKQDGGDPLQGQQNLSDQVRYLNVSPPGGIAVICMEGNGIEFWERTWLLFETREAL